MLTIDYAGILTWSGELTGAMVVLVVVGFIISRIKG